MTELLYMEDSYIREFEGTVTALEDDGVTLDRTAFYPRGGGQPADTGTLTWSGEEHVVTDLRRKHGDVIHVLESANPQNVTDVVGLIDWGRRYAFMRHHTALHILSRAVFDLYGGLVTGGGIYLERARMDFDVDRLDKGRVERIEEESNRVVAEGRDISVSFLPREEAMEIPDLIRTKVNLVPPSIETIRVVEIDGFDLQADGGTHVKNTKEVGRIRIVKTVNKGRENRRIEIELH